MQSEIDSELKSLYADREEEKKLLQAYVDEIQESQKLLEMKNRELLNYQKNITEKERLLNSIFESSKIGICVTDENGFFVKANRSYCEMHGYKEEELIGRHFSMVVHPEQKEYAYKIHDDFISGIDEPPTEWDAIDKNRRTFKILVTASRLILDDGRVHKVTTVMNISEISKIQERIKDDEKRFRALFEGSLGVVLVYTIDEELRAENFIDINKEANRVLGYSKEQIKLLNIKDLIPEMDEKSILKLHTMLMDVKSVKMQKTIETSKSEKIVTEIEVYTVLLEHKKAVVLIARDNNA